MEVFLSGLPDYLSHDTLVGELLRLVSQFGITRNDFECEKGRGKRFAHVTFRTLKHGQQFLNRYGEVVSVAQPQPTRLKNGSVFSHGIGNNSPGGGNDKGPRTESRLRILSHKVWCKKSTKEPNPITIRGLEEACRVAHEKTSKVAQNTHREEERGDKSVEFAVREVGCGHYAFVRKDLVFLPEQSWYRFGTAKFTRINLVITLDPGSPAATQIRIPLTTIHEIVSSHDGGARSSLTITLKTVPWFLTNEKTVQDMFAQVSISGRTSKTEQNRMVAMDDQHSEIVGTCLIYRLVVDSASFLGKIRALERKHFTTITRYDLGPAWIVPHPTLGVFREQLKALKKDLAEATKNNTLPFDTLFVVQSLAYNAYLHPATVRGILEKLIIRYKQDKQKGRTPIKTAAVKAIMQCISWPSPYGDPSEFEVDPCMEWIIRKNEEILTGFDLRDGELLQNPNLTHIYRAVVTPTRITLHGPEVENKNRVLRKHPRHQDYFVRVQFCDEDSQDMRFSPKIAYDRIYARFLDVISCGIQIAGRTYSFLGFSHSSLRSHSVWFSAAFFADGTLHNSTTIIQKLGDFDRIRCPAKCAARIGQAFSETPSVVHLEQYDEIYVNDKLPEITNHDGSRVFSDGVGKVSEEMMHIIWENIPMKKNAPTCFQIRIGGAKGMLAVDTTIPGRQICLRPSMIKFESQDTNQLEICDSGSKPIPLVLNRQMIKILEDMGVDKNWFHRLQEIRLNTLRSITSSAYNTWHFLDSQNIGQSIKLGRFINFVSECGMDYRTDDFLRGVIEVAVLRELRLLKHKARIPVKYGKTLFGIVDETGALEEGQVYVTFGFSKSGHNQPPPPAHGQAIVITRSPALYPGDIQVVENVVPPAGHPLAAHTNCVVFSRHGERDLPSKLSGGDLDGDIYNVIWDEGGMPRECFPPADYPRVDPMDIGRRVETKDMAEFFINFMRTDHLGVIATRHVILADQLPDGTLSNDCRKLAELHSTAVDFSKTGVPVDLKKLPRANKFRPDFLSPGPITEYHDLGQIEFEKDDDEAEVEDGESPRHKYYRSLKVLGELYRGVDEEKIWEEDIRLVADKSKPPFWDMFLNWAFDAAARLGAIGWPLRVEEARRLKSAYDDAIYGHMSKYSDHPVDPISEREVFIGSILNKTGVQTHRQRDSSHKLRDEFDRTAAYFARQMRRDALGDNSQPLTGYLAEMNDYGAMATLDLSLACICVASEKDCKVVAARLGTAKKSRGIGAGRGWGRGGDGNEELQSFRVVAATEFLRELRIKQTEMRPAGAGGGGGYVGISASA